MKPIKAWHFVGVNAAGLPVLRDGRPVVVGEWVVHDGPVQLCYSGLHASRRLVDALRFAPGTILCRVECADVAAEDKDKLVCRRRRVLWWGDAADALGVFARWCALDVAHLWSCPGVVREFLATGDESLRKDAAAAWAAADADDADAWGAAAQAAAEARQSRTLEWLIDGIVARGAT